MSFPHGSTALIHIGKCGGRTIKDGIGKATKNKRVVVVHTVRPIYREDLKYIIIARGPVSRACSVFRARYKTIITEGRDRGKFAGEFGVLGKYGSIGNLAESLYRKDGAVNAAAHRDIRRVHHMREDIFFYLGELLSRCLPDQVIAVLMQESLNDDISRVFGYKNKLWRHRNPFTGDGPELSKTAEVNLRRFFWKDYEALVRLYCWGKITQPVFVKAMGR